MTDKRSLSDQDVVNLLGRLKSVKSEYPADLREKRRTLFLGSIAAGALLGVPKHVNLPHGVEAPMSTAMKVAIGVLTTSAVTVAATLGTYVYENRAILAERIFGKTPTAVYISPVPASAVPFTQTLAPTATSELTPTVTLEFTPEPETKPIENTPLPPSIEPTNGLHLGQTPHPTKAPPPGKSTPSP